MSLPAAGRTALTLLVAFVAIGFVLPPERAVPLRIATAAAFATGLVTLRRAVGDGRRPEHPRGPVAVDLGPPDEQVVRLARLESALRFAVESRRQFDRTIRPLLCRLAEERLRSEHGITLTGRPADARALMGDELWSLVAEEQAGRQGLGPAPGPADLQRLVARVRQI